jgi:hypothetical protein
MTYWVAATIESARVEVGRDCESASRLLVDFGVLNDNLIK